MKEILENTAETCEYLESLPKIYMIACWAKYGVQEFPFAGTITKSGIVEVWEHVDYNGACDEWHRVPITYTTTGQIYAWTISKKRAEEIAAALNEKQEKENRSKVK